MLHLTIKEAAHQKRCSMSRICQLLKEDVFDFIEIKNQKFIINNERFQKYTKNSLLSKKVTELEKENKELTDLLSEKSIALSLLQDTVDRILFVAQERELIAYRHIKAILDGDMNLDPDTFIHLFRRKKKENDLLRKKNRDLELLIAEMQDNIEFLVDEKYSADRDALHSWTNRRSLSFK
jgi:hypothetical protein